MFPSHFQCQDVGNKKGPSNTTGCIVKWPAVSSADCWTTKMQIYVKRAILKFMCYMTNFQSNSMVVYIGLMPVIYNIQSSVDVKYALLHVLTVYHF